MRVFCGVDGLRAAVGERLGTSDWVTVERSRIEQFAEVTDDHDWFPEDRKNVPDSRFREGVAHGFLTLSLLPMMVREVYRVEGMRAGLNYGLNRVRFTAPVPVGGRVRAVVDLAEVTDVGAAVQLRVVVTVELEGSERPAMIAEWLTRLCH